MTHRAMDPKDSVVSVWQGGVNRGEFIGSAFFVSSSLLLTARHVVRDETSNTDYEKLSLGLVQGQNQVDLDPKNIYCHEDLDIALIYLKDPNEKQPLCSLNLDRDDYRDQSVDCFGVNKDNKNRDANCNYNVGTLDQKHGGYCFDHRVKKGFSGGPVSLHQSNRVIGVISQRDKEDQETLFIPLYQCKDWLIEINKKINDQVLADTLNPVSFPEENISQRIQFANCLEKLTIFIERPLEAYQHVINSLKAGATQVKICLCLYTSEQDKPGAFAQSLAVKLASQRAENPKQKLFEFVENQDFDAVNVATTAWRSKNDDEFMQRCMTDILESFSESAIDPNTQQKSADLDQKILTILRNATSPKVLMLSCCPQNQEKNWLFARYRLKKKLKQRFQWIKQFNQYWQNLTASEDIQPVAFLFFVRVDDNIEIATKCFNLKKIQENEFNDWTAFVDQILRTQGFCMQGELFKLLQDYRDEFWASLDKQKLAFPLSYQQFISQTKKLTEQH